MDRLPASLGDLVEVEPLGAAVAFSERVGLVDIVEPFRKQARPPDLSIPGRSMPPSRISRAAPSTMNPTCSGGWKPCPPFWIPTVRTSPAHG